MFIELGCFVVILVIAVDHVAHARARRLHGRIASSFTARSGSSRSTFSTDGALLGQS